MFQRKNREERIEDAATASPPGAAPWSGDPVADGGASRSEQEGRLSQQEQRHLAAVETEMQVWRPDGPPEPGRHAEPSPPRPEAPDSRDQAPARDWSPIVVDTAISDFEPQPPILTGVNRPDTEFDGWSTPELTLRSASVRGYLHRHNGKPRQDAVETAYLPEFGTVVFAVADGVSSAPRAELGATVACRAFVANLVRQLGLRQALDWQHAVDSTIDALLVEGSRLPGVSVGDPSQIERQLATTLVAGTVWPTEGGMLVTLIQIGDSGAWVLDHEGYRPVLASKHDRQGAVVSNAVSPLPRRPPAPVTGTALRFVPGQVLLVGTDGFGDPLGDGDGLVGELFGRHLLAGPPPAVGLAHLLDFSRELFDDDRTLLALWPLPHAWGSSG
jgi:hypothetical protein